MCRPYRALDLEPPTFPRLCSLGWYIAAPLGLPDGSGVGVITKTSNTRRVRKGKAQLVFLLRRATADRLLNVHNRRRSLVVPPSPRLWRTFGGSQRTTV